MMVTAGKWSLQIEKMPCGGFVVMDGYRSHGDSMLKQMLFASDTLEGACKYIKAAMTYVAAEDKK